MTETKKVVPTVLDASDPSGENVSQTIYDKIDQDWMEQEWKFNPLFTCQFAAFNFRVSESTIVRWCKDTYGMNFMEMKRGFQGYFKSNIMKKQFEGAMAGNTALLIHLGETVCGQGEASKDKGLTVIPLAYVPLSQREKPDGSAED